MLEQIKESILRFFGKGNIGDRFIFPYSSDEKERRKQIWDNLQRGILFEDNGLFIPWKTSFDDLNELCEKREDSGDRTEWYLGEHAILNGYKSHIEVMKWIFISRFKSFKKISENIGRDEEGMKNFNYLKTYITNLLGEPTKMELEKFGSFDIGVINWENNLVSCQS